MSKFLKNTSALLIASGLFLSLTTAASATSGPVGSNSLRTESGPGVGQVTLNWVRFYQNVDNYTISYGTKPGQYSYTTGNINNVVVDTIGGLIPGQKYYFFINPYFQGQALTPVSPEVSEVAAATPHTVIGTAGPYGNRGLTATSGPLPGQITLTWTQRNPSTYGFNLVYGLAPGKYQFGAQNIAGGLSVGQNASFTVGYLNPGQRYYFAVTPLRNDGTGAWNSAEVSQVAHQ